jgi:hypothetical protein
LEDEINTSEAADMAAQIRRDLLVRRLLDPGGPVPDDGAAASTSFEETIENRTEGHAAVASRWVPHSADARAVIEDTEKTLKEAAARAATKRSELTAFLEQIKSRKFEEPSSGGSRPSAGPSRRNSDGASEAKRPQESELLVSMPVDFDDLVDLNAQLSTQRLVHAKSQRSSTVAGASGPTAPRASVPRLAGPEAKDATPAVEANDRLAIPAFLEKYFDQEKAIEQLPHKRLEKEELEEERIRLPEEETELQRGLRQIARLDGLLLKREAAGTARLQAAQLELEAARDKLAREAERVQEEKIEVLRRLKERGLIGSGAASVASRDTSKCSTVEPYSSPQSGSASSRSLSTVDGGEPAVGRSQASALVAVRQDLVEVPSTPTDWSGWTSTASPAADEESEGLQCSDSPHGRSADAVPPTTTNVTDSDTSTFELTSMTAASLIGGRRPHPQSSANSSTLVLKRPSTGLATVAEDDAGGDDENKEPSVEDDLDVVVDDPYAEDTEALDALRRIDEQLQRLVPEQEWEAKSICSFSSRAAGSGAGEGSVAASRAVRSVWSRASGDGSVPGDPMLCEQYETRVAEMALVSIDSRLRDIQYAEVGDEHPAPEEIQKLLLQAAQETAAPDAKSRVLALTGTAPLDATETSANSSIEDSANPLALAPATYKDTGLIVKARQILSRLEDCGNDWNDAFGEAQSSLIQLEEDVKYLEDTDTRPQGGPQTSGVEAHSDPEAMAREAEPSAVAPFVKRLEDLRAEVQIVLEKEGPDEALLAKLRRQLESREVEAEPELLATFTASQHLSSEGTDDRGVAVDDDLDFEYYGDFHPGNTNLDGPNLELLRALDIELPSSDGLWETDELERVVTAMNKHYGDVPPPLEEVESALQALDEDGEDDELAPK